MQNKKIIKCILSQANRKNCLHSEFCIFLCLEAMNDGCVVLKNSSWSRSRWPSYSWHPEVQCALKHNIPSSDLHGNRHSFHWLHWKIWRNVAHNKDWVSLEITYNWALLRKIILGFGREGLEHNWCLGLPAPKKPPCLCPQDGLSCVSAMFRSIDGALVLHIFLAIHVHESKVKITGISAETCKELFVYALPFPVGRSQ